MTDWVISEKLSRLRNGARPRVLDLFSGCGGLSLGFNAAGFEITAAMENDPTAAASYSANFHADDPRHAVHRDITSTTPGQLVRALNLGTTAKAFDIVIGGPPCQAFARVGRSKLREIEEHPEAFRHDARATLYSHYLRYVKSCRPLAVLMENVPDIMNFGGHNVPEEVCEELEDIGYVCAYTLLNSAFYGVPQTRERMFLIAYHREIARCASFPKPTHWVDLPPGYEGSRRVALKALSNAGLIAEAHHYMEPPESTCTLAAAVTAEEAIGDLPEIDARTLLHAGELKRGARRFDTLMPYDESRPVSEYARAMKDWPRFESGDGLYDHVIRYLPRDYPLFARMSEGDQYPEAHKLALRMFDEKLSELTRNGVSVEPGSVEHEELRGSIVPPYDASKFPNKWRKISRDQPVRTVMAHLSKDGYSHIHYDDAQARTISVREAARIQSFPDGFVLKGAMNQAFRQIGNAVPPLMARAIAAEIMESIREAVSAHSSKPSSQVAATSVVQVRMPLAADSQRAMGKAIEA
ncbi:MAG: DNA cytosine methyltransferase [Acidobacteriia bacterium]|nr:DNA cytosine methyltransferase [Terriglobia bacterium]